MSLSSSETIHALAYPLHFDADKGQFAKTADYDRYVAGLVKQVLLTAPGERINRPRFGTPLSQILFGPLNEEIASLLEAQIVRALEQWLGNVIRVDRVTTAIIAQTTLEVRLSYVVLATGVSDVLTQQVGS
jgi:phage baseplate assembly protein W